MGLKRLPVNKCDFKTIQEGNYLYIDKTKQIYDFLQTGEAFFLSRPRRFGKSLLVSTLNELFANNKELFKDTWIYNSDWKWQKHTIIRLDFSHKAFDSKASFEANFMLTLDTIAQENNFSLKEIPFLGTKCEMLIKTLAAKSPVVLLVDEYDSALLKNLEDPKIAKQIQTVMHIFYSAVKAYNHLLAYIFITGITRFSKMSLFSSMNNLTDLTFNPLCADLCGYTQTELEKNYSDYFQLLTQKKQWSLPFLYQQIKHWYNGYRFSENPINVYNPFSVVNLCQHLAFSNYWYDSGCPSYLANLLRKHYFETQGIENIYYDIFYLKNGINDDNNINFIPLLLQAGYLTITDYREKTNEFKLDYPNFENKQALNRLILDLYVHQTELVVIQTVNRLREALLTLNFENFFILFTNLIASIPYMNREKSEKYYSSIFHIVLNLLELMPFSEVNTHTGRIDTVVQLDNFIFIFEYKFNETPKKALQQIETKKYYEGFLNSKKEIVCIGISFNYIEKKLKTNTGPTFNIEWEVKK